jgi:hypothetical protein
MGEYRDIQNGVNDPIDGSDVTKVRRPLPPQQEQEHAPMQGEEFLPEALRRAPAKPLNKRTGRNPTD